MKIIKEKCYKKIEKKLQNYTIYQEAIAEMTCSKGMKYSDNGHGKYGKNSSTEEQIEKKIGLESKLNEIDSLVQKLSSREKEIIKLYYIENTYSWHDISKEIGISITKCKQYRAMAIQKLAFAKYGDIAIDWDRIKQNIYAQLLASGQAPFL